jgi:hypothetical protein
MQAPPLFTPPHDPLIAPLPKITPTDMSVITIAIIPNVTRNSIILLLLFKKNMVFHSSEKNGG